MLILFGNCVFLSYRCFINPLLASKYMQFVNIQQPYSVKKNKNLEEKSHKNVLFKLSSKMISSNKSALTMIYNTM